MKSPKERPIIMLVWEVQALMEGRKTEIRRLAKPAKSNFDQLFTSCNPKLRRPHCHFSRVGERLWVKEPFWEIPPGAVPEGAYTIQGWAGIPGPPGLRYRIMYAADGLWPLPVWRVRKYPYWVPEMPEGQNGSEADRAKKPRWTQEMDRTWSRFTLEVTGLRTQRLTDVTEADALAEGAENLEDYITRWHQMYGKPENRWAACRTVWVATIKVVDAYLPELVTAVSTQENPR